jgi:hypothetical protein
MELGISGRNATLVRREDRYCKSCQSLTLHFLYEELDISFSVCIPCVAHYMAYLPWEEIGPIVRKVIAR